jgi:SAM-dependent methyltransferase
MERHSERFLTDARDRWWNLDFLDLMAARLGLGSVHDALDVGCGQGHWTRLVARMLSADARIVGVDREPAWVERAATLADARTRFTCGEAEALPFPDASFDLVTCQTLLIHVRDPGAVIAEMRRVLRPGGRVLLCEPNNLAGACSGWAAQPDGDVEDMLGTVRLIATIERGKRALGEGYNSLGEGLVGWLRDGWTDVDVWLNDRVRPVWSPYNDLDLEGERRDHEAGEFGWSRVEAERWFVAGGGADFEACWRAALRGQAARLAAIDAGHYAASEGGLTYLVSASRA